ncbi:hypothetical protein F3F59_17175 [Bacteroides ovatus]|nr:hypothetical protein F3F59_17175 [Bacteroides ovatus]KAB4216830.1 hypothetical protein GAQ04_06465 [Bacteroides uniformis]
MERSGTLLLLSVAMEWNFHLLQKSISRVLLGIENTEQPDGIFFPKGRHFRHRIQYDKSEVAANICELTI